MSLNKKGFTLIELLVVIAIIGILASIVLTSLNDARNKGYDTQVKSDVAQIRTGMEMCYDNLNGTYTDCAAGANNVPNLTRPACSTAGYVISINAGGTDYAVSADLCAATGNWCVDTAGYAGVGAVSAGGTAAGACN